MNFIKFLIFFIIINAIISKQIDIKVATIHFSPILGKKNENIDSLLKLNEEAARNNAQIILNTEMSTSGYSFFSRSELKEVSETIPGETTSKFSDLAKQYLVYIILGMPEYSSKYNLFYNSAVLINPEGKIQGVYHKRSNVLESSYNAIDFDEIPVFETIYGKIGIGICADTHYPQIPRILSVKGANILFVPINSGSSLEPFRVLAYENDISIVLANRYGEEITEEQLHIFNQETFRITSPYKYNFNFGGHSGIIRKDGEVLIDIMEKNNRIGYGTIPINYNNNFPVIRRPSLYSLLAQDTLQNYLQKNMGLPKPANFTAAAINPKNFHNPWDASLKIMNELIKNNTNLKIIVLPADLISIPDEEEIKKIELFCFLNNIDVVLHYSDTNPPSSELITNEKNHYIYKRTHNKRNENINISNEFLIVDRPYARLSILHDVDMIAPETNIIMAKMGVDLIIVNANFNNELINFLWKKRSDYYLHIIVANLKGKSGIYFGGYKNDPSFIENDEIIMSNINTADVREKFDFKCVNVLPLLDNSLIK